MPTKLDKQPKNSIFDHHLKHNSNGDKTGKINFILKYILKEFCMFYVYITANFMQYKPQNRELLQNPKDFEYVVMQLFLGITQLINAPFNYYVVCLKSKTESKKDGWPISDHRLSHKKDTISSFCSGFISFNLYQVSRKLKPWRNENKTIENRAEDIVARKCMSIREIAILNCKLAFSSEKEEQSGIDNQTIIHWNLSVIDEAIQSLDKIRNQENNNLVIKMLLWSMDIVLRGTKQVIEEKYISK